MRYFSYVLAVCIFNSLFSMQHAYVKSLSFEEAAKLHVLCCCSVVPGSRVDRCAQRVCPCFWEKVELSDGTRDRICKCGKCGQTLTCSLTTGVCGWWTYLLMGLVS